MGFPNNDTVRDAVRGLAVWSTQLWNIICRGEDPASISAGVTDDREPEVGELIHAASDALRVVPAGILQPVLQLVSKPQKLADGGQAAASAQMQDNTQDIAQHPSAGSLSPCGPLAAILAQSWNSYVTVQ